MKSAHYIAAPLLSRLIKSLLREGPWDHYWHAAHLSTTLTGGASGCQNNWPCSVITGVSVIGLGEIRGSFTARPPATPKAGCAAVSLNWTHRPLLIRRCLARSQ